MVETTMMLMWLSPVPNLKLKTLDYYLEPIQFVTCVHYNTFLSIKPHLLIQDIMVGI